MPIVSKPVASLNLRDLLLCDIGMMIDDAENSPDEISPWTLAGTLLKYIEERIDYIENNGTVIYRV